MKKPRSLRHMKRANDILGMAFGPGDSVSVGPGDSVSVGPGDSVGMETLLDDLTMELKVEVGMFLEDVQSLQQYMKCGRTYKQAAETIMQKYNLLSQDVPHWVSCIEDSNAGLLQLLFQYGTRIDEDTLRMLFVTARTNFHRKRTAESFSVLKVLYGCNILKRVSNTTFIFVCVLADENFRATDPLDRYFAQSRALVQKCFECDFLKRTIDYNLASSSAFLRKFFSLNTHGDVYCDPDRIIKIDSEEFTPLMYTILKNRFDVARILLESGADANAVAFNEGRAQKRTPLDCALKRIIDGGNIHRITDMLDLLIGEGADPRLVSTDLKTFTETPVQRNVRDLLIRALLLESWMGDNFRVRLGHDLLVYSPFISDRSFCSVFRTGIGDIYTRVGPASRLVKDHEIPAARLAAAQLFSRHGLLKRAIDCGKIKKLLRETSLVLEQFENPPKVIDLEEELSQADMQPMNCNAMIYALLNNKVGTVRQLLDAGADVDARQYNEAKAPSQRMRPLDCCLRMNAGAESARLLLEKGADLTLMVTNLFHGEEQGVDARNVILQSMTDTIHWDMRNAHTLRCKALLQKYYQDDRTKMTLIESIGDLYSEAELREHYEAAILRSDYFMSELLLR